MAKIIVITDMTMIGSGYYYLMTNLLTGLAGKGHDISVAGLGYMGEPHPYPFQIIPTQMPQDATSIVKNLLYLNRENPKTCIMVGLDIPYQITFRNEFKDSGRKYFGITPMENGPLVQSWAMGLSSIDFLWLISEMAKQECLKVGLKNVDHLNVGVDTVLWHPPSPEDRKQLRQGMGLEPDEFVVMTVADNQERKNLWAGMEAVRKLKELHPDLKFRYIMVTKEDTPVGWKLRDLAQSEGLLREYLPFQRGIPPQNLWGLYACADAYLQPSKAEGLGLPVLEAMACGVPVVCTNTGAMTELCMNGRGLLAKVAYSHIDVWGNSKRDWVDTEDAARLLSDIIQWRSEGSPFPTQPALDYVRSRTWDIAVEQVHSKLTEVLDGTTQAQKVEG